MHKAERLENTKVSIFVGDGIGAVVKRCTRYLPIGAFNRTCAIKQRQGRRQRERHKFAYLAGKNNSFARPARAFFTFVHFFAVVSKTTT